MVSDFSDMEDSRDDSNENEKHKKLRDKLRREKQKQLQDRTSRIISTHYDTIKYAIRMHNLNLPNNIDDTIKSREHCLDKIYGKEKPKLEKIIELDPFNTDKIKNFLDAIVFKKIPLLKKTFEDEQKRKTKKKREGVKNTSFVKKISDGDSMLQTVMRKTRYNYGRSMDTFHPKNYVPNDRDDMQQVTDFLHQKTQRSMFSRFLDCVRKGEILGSMNEFYKRNSYMKDIIDDEIKTTNRK
jgi:hypothetical protein